MYEFDVKRPATVDQAVDGFGEDDVFLAGGQTFIPALKARLAMPETLVDLAGIEALSFVRRGGASVSIGAMTPHADVAAHGDVFSGLAQLAGQIGDPAVRSRGTIGGSLANNDPSACYPAAALACGAEIVTTQRRIKADDFFDGMFGTAIDAGELITQVDFPVPLQSAYVKFKQPASRFALVGVFVARFENDTRVAVTGASNDGVFRWAEAETALNAGFNATALDDLTLPEDDMIEDLHATPRYRAHLVKVMTQRAVVEAG